jgi:Serine dehydrogenase proteinase
MRTPDYREIDSGQRKAIHALGRRFADLAGGHPCLLLIGKIIGLGDVGESTERRIQLACQMRFGFPMAVPQETINVILDSMGGPLDSAFRSVLYLSRYAETLNVYIPRKAKSASTLIAVGANKIVMSPFAELGPLDNQIRDSRNPTDYMSALDCLQSAQILISRAADIDQLKAEQIASRLVYGYTHHLFPIDITEAFNIGLNPEEMSREEYETAVEIVSACNDNQVCVEFVNGHAEPG